MSTLAEIARRYWVAVLITALIALSVCPAPPDAPATSPTSTALSPNASTIPALELFRKRDAYREALRA
jgi:hypothetical protein